MRADIHDGQEHNVPFKGRIQKRKTYHLQIVTFGLQRAAGPYRCATNGREQTQQGSPYSSTSSAATSKPGGTVRPSAFAVLRLRIVSNLVAACTGRSAGLSPRRMRSTYLAACRHMSTKSFP